MSKIFKIRRGTKAEVEAFPIPLSELIHAYDVDEIYLGGNNGNVKVAGRIPFVSIDSKGAQGNGITDDTAAMQAAINAMGDTRVLYIPEKEFYFTGQITIPSNTLVIGSGAKSILAPNNAGGNTIKLLGDNITFANVRIEGSTPAVISVEGSHIKIKDVYFKTNGTKLGQCVYMFTSDDIIVDSCIFDNTGYGVIQKAGTVSNNIKVVNCTAFDMIDDFVELNCTSSARSKNVIIANNIFKGSASYALARAAELGGDYTTYLEKRFVGITAVDNVIIESNIVEFVAGDSAIHVEDIGSDLHVKNNIFDNILGRGYIFVTQGDGTINEMLIEGNTFKRTDNLSATGNVLYLVTDVFTSEINFINNIIKGNSVVRNLKVAAQFQSYLNVLNNTFRYCTEALQIESAKNSKFNNNVFRQCNKAILGWNANDCEILDNKVVDCEIGFDFGDGTHTKGAVKDCLFMGNVFNGMNGYNLIARRKSDGTQPPERVTVLNNIFDQNPSGASVYIAGNAASGALASQSCTVMNNTFKTGATLDFSLADKEVYGNNIFNDKNWRQPLNVVTDIASAPEYVGQTAIVAGVGYLSTGTASAADWKQITNV